MSEYWSITNISGIQMLFILLLYPRDPYLLTLLHEVEISLSCEALHSSWLILGFLMRPREKESLDVRYGYIQTKVTQVDF